MRLFVIGLLVLWIGLGAGCQLVAQISPPQSSPGMADFQRGEQLSKDGKFNEAVEAYTRAVEQGMKNAAVYKARGLAADNAGNLWKAIEDFGRAIELSPDDAEAYYHRATAQMAQCECQLGPAIYGVRQQAATDLRKYLELSPSAANRAEVERRIQTLAQ